MARPRTVPREGDLFVTICPNCGKKRLLKTNPCGRRNTVCTSCLRTGKATKPSFELPYGAVELYLSGISAARLAAQYGVTPNAVLHSLRRVGVDCRTMSEAIKLLNNAGRLRQILDTLRDAGELSRRQSAGLQGIPLHEWQGFKRDYWSRIRSGVEWGRWREKVYARDGYRCLLCGAPSTRANRLQPHHIHKKSLYPEWTFDVDNGATLCARCHHGVTGQEEEWAPFFEVMLACA